MKRKHQEDLQEWRKKIAKEEQFVNEADRIQKETETRLEVHFHSAFSRYFE